MRLCQIRKVRERKGFTLGRCALASVGAHLLHFWYTLRMPFYRRPEIGIGVTPDCGQIDLSKTGIPVQQQQIAIAACENAKKELAGYAQSYAEEYGYTPQQAKEAAEAYKALKSITSIVDYVSENSNSLIMTKEQIVARNTKFYSDVGIALGIGVTLVAGPVVGAAVAAIYAIITVATMWIGDLLGLNDPAPVSERILFQNPCDPNSPDIKTIWPNGIPAGPSDPRWIDDPVGYRKTHPNEGSNTGAINIASPPFDKSKYEWRSGLNPNGQFESLAFAIIVQNVINRVNCSPFVNFQDLLESIVQTWNMSRDKRQEFKLIKIDIEPAPNGSPFLHASNPDKVVDPITQLFIYTRFDFAASQADGGRPHWLNTNSFYIIDGPPIPSPNAWIYGTANLDGTTPSKEPSTASKVLKTTAVITGVAAASLGAYAYFTKQTFTGAARNLYGRAKGTITNTFSRGVKENPLALPERTDAIVPYDPPTEIVSYVPPTEIVSYGSHNKGRRVAYQVDLNGDPYIETIRVLPNGDALIYRHTRPIAKFAPSPYQLAKIRSGNGSLSIYVDQLLV